MLGACCPNLAIGQEWELMDYSKADTTINKDGKITHIDDWEGHSLFFYYYETGELSQITYSLQTRERIQDFIRMYRPGGQLWTEHYQVGKGKLISIMRLDSLYLGYNEQGQLIEKLNYKRGKKHGENLYYYPNGKVAGREILDEGRLMNATYYDENGLELDSGDLKDGNGTLIHYDQGMMGGICDVKDGKVKKCRCL